MNDHPPIFTRPVPLFPYSSPFRSRWRLWGSVAFIATSVGIGAALAGRGEELIIQTIVACLFGVFVATALLPNRPTPPGSRGSRPALTLLRMPPFLLFVLCGGLNMASHAVHIAQLLVPMARLAGFVNTVIDTLGLFAAAISDERRVGQE